MSKRTFESKITDKEASEQAELLITDAKKFFVKRDDEQCNKILDQLIRLLKSRIQGETLNERFYRVKTLLDEFRIFLNDTRLTWISQPNNAAFRYRAASAIHWLLDYLVLDKYLEEDLTLEKDEAAALKTLVGDLRRDKDEPDIQYEIECSNQNIASMTQQPKNLEILKKIFNLGTQKDIGGLIGYALEGFGIIESDWWSPLILYIRRVSPLAKNSLQDFETMQACIASRCQKKMKFEVCYATQEALAEIISGAKLPVRNQIHEKAIGYLKDSKEEKSQLSINLWFFTTEKLGAWYRSEESIIRYRYRLIVGLRDLIEEHIRLTKSNIGSLFSKTHFDFLREMMVRLNNKKLSKKEMVKWSQWISAANNHIAVATKEETLFDEFKTPDVSRRHAEHDRDELIENNKKLTGEVEENKSQLHKVQADLKEKENEINKFSQERVKLLDDREELLVERQKMIQKREADQQAIEDLKHSLSDSHTNIKATEEKLSQLAASLGASQLKEQQLNEELSLLKKDGDQNKDRIEQLQGQLEQEKDKLLKLKQEKEQLDQNLQNKKFDSEKIREKMDSLEKELKVEKQMRSQKESEFAARDQSLKEQENIFRQKTAALSKETETLKVQQVVLRDKELLLQQQKGDLDEQVAVVKMQLQEILDFFSSRPPQSSTPTHEAKQSLASSSSSSASSSSANSQASVLQESKQSALINACEQGDIKKVKTQIAGGAKAALPDKSGKLPLGSAVWSMDPDIVMELLNAILKEGQTCMTWEECKMHNQIWYQEVFVMPKFDPRTYGQWSEFLIKIEHFPSLRQTHLRIVNSYWNEAKPTFDWEHLKKLVGSQPEAKKCVKGDPLLGMSPHILGAGLSETEDRFQEWRHLIQKRIERAMPGQQPGAVNVSSGPNIYKNQQLTPAIQSGLQRELINSCQRGDVKAVHAVIAKGAKPNLADEKGKLPLGAAIYGMCPEVIDFLVDRLGGKITGSWVELEAHNRRHYQETYLISVWHPDSLDALLALLEKIKPNIYLSACYAHRAAWKFSMDVYKNQFKYETGPVDGTFEDCVKEIKGRKASLEALIASVKQNPMQLGRQVNMAKAINDTCVGYIRSENMFVSQANISRSGLSTRANDMIFEDLRNQIKNKVEQACLRSVAEFR